MIPPPESYSYPTVRRYLIDSCEAAFGCRGLPRLEELADQSHRLFMGQIRPYQASDTAYHDLEHTLQVTV